MKDIDWVHHSLRVEETVVDKKTKGPKTFAGYREVLLLPQALEALNSQKEFTFLNQGRVFYRPGTKQPWESSQQLRQTADSHANRQTAWMPLKTIRCSLS